MNDKLTIFLSHSHKDLGKVRKLRDILESLDFEPLIFYLKCLDDNYDELEDFIKREIDARSVFIYCKSKNSEQSEWVQKELQYIKQSDSRRIYTIDIDQPLNQTFVTLLNSLCELIKNNTIFLSYSRRDIKLCNSLKKVLNKGGYRCIMRHEVMYNEKKHEYVREQIAKNGIFIPIITTNYMKSIYCLSEFEGVLMSIDYGLNPLVLPLIVNYNYDSIIKLSPKLCNYKTYSFEFENRLRKVDESNILNILRKMTIK